MLVDVELDAGTELDATARGSDLDCAQRESRREAQGAAERSTRRGQHEARAARSVRREVRARRARLESTGARSVGAGRSIPFGQTDAW